MIITRYSSGYFGGTIYSILNILTQCAFFLSWGDVTFLNVTI